mmetsp:Transcript_32562/g.36922  ORF Transcript_32562/g.36922 Transcript_32562/m.36922 type:complete len:213 (-) Transcript_32562:242-880(-)
MTTLHYFDVHGRGDPIRFMLYHAKVDFEDKRYSFEEFGPVKETLGLEFGQIPMLEFEGKKLFQTNAILEYIGAKFGYRVTDPEQVYLANWYKEASADFVTPYFMKIAFNRDEESKKEALDAWALTIPKYTAAIEKKFNESNAKEQGYLVRDSITIVDFGMISLHERILNGPFKELTRPAYQTNAPNFTAWVDAKVTEHNYYFGTDKRPDRFA